MARRTNDLPLLVNSVQPTGTYDEFDDVREFQDDVHDEIYLSPMERDIVDTPEFQRLFRLGQLGFVDLVFPTANHTRGAHSIGTCALAKRLVDVLRRNNPRFARLRQQYCGDATPIPKISPAERVLISAGALLHDISHGPFSHDIEKKTHEIPLDSQTGPLRLKSYYGSYDKHDHYDANPALYLFLLDEKSSVLARVLRHYSRRFFDLLVSDASAHPHLQDFVTKMRETWTTAQSEVLPALLFHLLVFEKKSDAANPILPLSNEFDSDGRIEWGLGPEDRNTRAALHRAWYQPFRHDIIGNTLSADLIDYLMRDHKRLGCSSRDLDLKLLAFYVLAPDAGNGGDSEEKIGPLKGRLYRTAIDLNDYKRGTIRAERINDIFRMLDLRHEIHEKAVYHRVVQSAIAMMSRTCLLLDREGVKPKMRALYGQDLDSPALAGDDHFLELLIHAETDRRLTQRNPEMASYGAFSTPTQTIPWKLAERRVYRPLMVISGDRVPILFGDSFNLQDDLNSTLRQLAAIVDLPYYAPFFLFVSSCIEQILQHKLGSPRHLQDYISTVLKDAGETKTASEVIPTRVIFWTTPYKQLYKDPALFVRVENELCTLEEVPKLTGSKRSRPVNAPDRLQNLRVRVAAGIRDAETKNEGLWKLYVFISDGLFYTGLLSKILPDHACAKNEEAHLEHLRWAEDIVVRALRTAWKDWEIRGPGRIDLAHRANPLEFAELLRLFQDGAHEFAHYHSDLAKDVSAVAVGQYLHGENLEKCRDIRYKFDAKGSAEEILATLRMTGEQRALVREVVNSLGLALNELGYEELRELVTRVARGVVFDNRFEKDVTAALERVAEEAALGRRPPILSELIRGLW